MRSYLLFLLIASFFVACGGDTTKSSTTVEKDNLKTETNPITPKPEPKEEGRIDLNNPYKLTPFEKSYPYAEAALTSFKYIKENFHFSVQNYELGKITPDVASKKCANSVKGQHIHLIMDNKPYAAKYESSFNYKLDGTHYMLAFLSRSYHESIKTDKARIAAKVTAKGGNLVKQEPITEPMLFYSRPKGTYIGKNTKKVMLDFYLLNTSISKEGYKVKADINGQIFMLTEWIPYYIEGLPMGKNTIKLSLMDAKGNLVDAPFTPVVRNFYLQEEEPAGN